MSFLDQKKNIENSQLRSENKSLQPYEETFLTRAPISLDKIKEKGIEYLYSDLLDGDISYEFRTSLGNSQYISANNEARACLDITLKARDLFPKKVPDWLEHSQKCFDHLLIKFISDGLKEKVEIPKSKVYETDIYVFLEDKDDENLKTIGLLFRLIYKHRSSFKHVHYTDREGYRRIRQLRNKDFDKAKNEIIAFYKESLTKFLPIYKKYFNHSSA